MRIVIPSKQQQQQQQQQQNKRFKQNLSNELT